MLIYSKHAQFEARSSTAHLAVQLGHNIGSVSGVPGLVVDSEAGSNIASQPVQAYISDQEVRTEGELAIGLSPV